MNIVLDEAVEEKDGGEKIRLGMVVCNTRFPPSTQSLFPLEHTLTSMRQVIRGNSVVMLEALERIGGDDRQNR